jgi:hypothetical protein
MKSIKKILATGITFMVIVGFNPYSANAAIAPHWGGHSIFPFPCTSGNVQYLQWYTPLYLSSSVPFSGFMGAAYAVTFAYYTLHPVQYALGTYTPGAAVCIFGSCPYCTYIPSWGLVLPYTGVSP